MTPPPNSDESRIVGFRVNDEDYEALQNYANIFSKTPQIDPNTGCQIVDTAGRTVIMLEKPHVGMLIKVATSAYIMGYELFKKQIAAAQVSGPPSTYCYV